MQKLIFTSAPGTELDKVLAEMRPGKVFVLADDNTVRLLPGLREKESKYLSGAQVITIPAGDAHKNLETLSHIWMQLSQKGATRTSVLVNFGGGVVTDIGGFAAATFKRGIRFINVPTTLLGAVDAAVGGKTGINFAGLKNEIGVFREAEAVVVSTVFFNTLPQAELLSGYAEMLKHGALQGEETLLRLLGFDIDSDNLDLDALLDMLRESVMVKKRVVESDPTEQGLRKTLNLGHTIGHALESLALERNRPVPHGYAVARGLVGALVLSHIKAGYPSPSLHSIAAFVKDKYGAPVITCDDYPRLLELMTHDKKNTTPDAVNFTLLSAPGKPEINRTASPEEIKTALDITRDLLGA